MGTLKKCRRGVIDPVTLGVLAGFALGIFGAKFSPFEFLKPKPPIAQLTKLQADLAKAQADAEQTRLAREAAVKEERAKLEAQVKAAQADNVGTATALSKIAAEHRTAEVKLAVSMANRVSLKLVAAVGALPQEQQDAMVQLIDAALSEKQSEVDAANAKLAARDREFATLTVERDQIKAQIPVLTAKAVAAEETVKVTQAKVTTVTEQVKVFADKADAKEREAGSLFGALNSAKNGLIGLGIVVAIIAALALYLRMGLGSVGKALHPLQKVLAPADYAKVVSSLDSETDRLHKWLISSGRKTAHFVDSQIHPAP